MFIVDQIAKCFVSLFHTYVLQLKFLKEAPATEVVPILFYCFVFLGGRGALWSASFVSFILCTGRVPAMECFFEAESTGQNVGLWTIQTEHEPKSNCV